MISTPYWHAEELLADGRGVIVPFGDSQAIANAVCELLRNEATRHAMRKSAYLIGRAMTWPTVAHDYVRSFERARVEHSAMAAKRIVPATLTARRRFPLAASIISCA